MNALSTDPEHLILAPNIERADDFYADLLAAHEGLTKSQSDALNARLVLVLANHIGTRAILTQALAAAALPQGETDT
ncbi:DUF2783 domain-containing protein [Phaeobacter inhibens]|uniref:DUF2783 domain-containing protein n=1 Tax=Phaeobacter inhibens TaxID=221822 RepID=A0ABM6R9K1_9RHOB|nr:MULTISPECIES: DUF2783 domain-containing protein [Phaeobacter]AFO89016.1 hypothetical protein PGA2_c30460 [Phaeobacter inhibens 2.10]AFO89788.1 hypothetical protein PGA1_c00400 [Phaeobacter inhibens DSM 17395]APX16064.1 hypothetical protein BWR17_09570 [Phaeobacter inhibens]AUQ44415.1 hypothetical protein PhaeoP10_00040 [Phaeobacter inhibens]AUQ48397.1 hypothetical protein PhaeoP83_00073 [Phaeobacter inhibens]